MLVSCAPWWPILFLFSPVARPYGNIISYVAPVSVSHIYSACFWQVLMSPFLCKTIDSQTEIWHCNESVGGGGGRVVE